jgi:hypothetical protein
MRTTLVAPAVLLGAALTAQNPAPAHRSGSELQSGIGVQGHYARSEGRQFVRTASARLGTGQSVAVIPEADGPEPRPVVSFGIDGTSKYFFRGIQQENQGAIVQPWAEVGFPVLVDGPLPLDLTLGTWNSVHDGPTGSGAGGSAWYESDVYAGLSTSYGVATFGATYAVYESPNGQWSSVQELVLDLGIDDGGLWAGFSGLQPSLSVAFELDGQMDSGTNEGVYFQLGIEPRFGLLEREGWLVEVSVPVTVGLGASGYYEDLSRGARDTTFGFFDVGGVVSTTMPFVPGRFGSWQASAGLHLLQLGDSNRALNQGDDFEVVGSLGVSVTF